MSAARAVTGVVNALRFCCSAFLDVSGVKKKKRAVGSETGPHLCKSRSDYAKSLFERIKVINTSAA